MGERSTCGAWLLALAAGVFEVSDTCGRLTVWLLVLEAGVFEDC